MLTLMVRKLCYILAGLIVGRRLGLPFFEAIDASFVAEEMMREKETST